MRILERWDMDISPTDPDDKWFLDWVLNAPRQAGRHLTAGWHALKSVRDADISSCTEYFGGLGAQALMVEELFAPGQHVVGDYSARAVEHLRGALPPRVAVRQADAYAPENLVPADLVILDFGDLTVWKARPGDPRADLLDRVMSHQPKAVLITDIAGRYLHLQRERYETLLGIGNCYPYPRYLEAFSRLLYDRYGMPLTAGYYHTWSSVLAFSAEGGGNIEPTPLTPVGIS